MWYKYYSLTESHYLFLLFVFTYLMPVIKAFSIGCFTI